MLTDIIKWIEIYYKVLDTINWQQINYWVYRGSYKPKDVRLNVWDYTRTTKAQNYLFRMERCLAERR